LPSWRSRFRERSSGWGLPLHRISPSDSVRGIAPNN
jgi:hypothetical protein